MTITTAFYRANRFVSGNCEKAGEVVWDGQRMTASHEWLQELIRDPIRAYEGDSWRWLCAVEDPELFVKSLWRDYKGSYMWATKPVVKE
jgi:hypothetical protein